MDQNSEDERRLYAGFSGVTMQGESFDLGYRVQLRPIYAHLMSPCLMAFKRAEPGKPHPSPWRAAKGGFNFDIEVEISAPLERRLPGDLSAQDTIWWIAALLRLSAHPYLLVPVLADAPFEADAHGGDPTIRPLETGEWSAPRRPFFPDEV